MPEEQEPRIKAIEWTQGRVRLLDQTRLPREAVYLDLDDYQQVVEAIKHLRVRGAPAIGVAAAYAMALAAQKEGPEERDVLLERLEVAADEIRSARPTAVNPAWAVERVLKAAQEDATPEEVRQRVLEEANRIYQENLLMDRRMAALGAAILPRGTSVLTHCNTGSLATAGWGTALGIICLAWRQKRLRGIFATESRPLLQGARLTTWELVQQGIPVTLVVDSAAGSLMRSEQVKCVIVGADRIAANGDVANKIGTYSLAVLAKENNVPFYVAAPTSTIDLKTPTGSAIPIEERGAQEVLQIGESSIAPEGVSVANPAFDVTPAHYVTAIITERGVVRQPYGERLRRLMEAPDNG